jgi:hypothetical protein
MPRDLEQISSFARVGNKNTLEQVSCMRCNIFGEGERGRDDVFVEQVDVVALWIGWVVIEGEVAGEHGIL